MTLRPIATRWFELVTVHKYLARTMECLSRTGAVELEARSGATHRLVLPEIDEQLKAIRELARRYQLFWPPAAPTDKRRVERLSEALGAARQRLATWAERADPIIAAIEDLSRTAGDIDRLNDALVQAGDEFPDLGLLAGCGPRLRAHLVEIPLGAKLRELPSLVLFKSWESARGSLVLVVGRKLDVDEIEGQISGWKVSSYPFRTGYPLRPGQLLLRSQRDAAK